MVVVVGGNVASGATYNSSVVFIDGGAGGSISVGVDGVNRWCRW